MEEILTKKWIFEKVMGSIFGLLLPATFLMMLFVFYDSHVIGMEIDQIENTLSSITEDTPVNITTETVMQFLKRADDISENKLKTYWSNTDEYYRVQYIRASCHYILASLDINSEENIQLSTMICNQIIKNYLYTKSLFYGKVNLLLGKINLQNAKINGKNRKAYLEESETQLHKAKLILSGFPDQRYEIADVHQALGKLSHEKRNEKLAISYYTTAISKIIGNHDKFAAKTTDIYIDLVTSYYEIERNSDNFTYTKKLIVILEQWVEKKPRSYAILAGLKGSMNRTEAKRSKNPDTKDSLIKDAITNHFDSLKYLTFKNFPYYYSRAYYNLGLDYEEYASACNQDKNKRFVLLWKAKRAYEEARRIDRAKYNRYYTILDVNLAKVLLELSKDQILEKEERIKTLKTALNLSKEAVFELTVLNLTKQIPEVYFTENTTCLKEILLELYILTGNPEYEERANYLKSVKITDISDLPF